MQNPLWDYASTIYGNDGVAPVCLALQDQFGIDVNLLLYAAWLAHSHQILVAEHLFALEAVVGDWRDQVIRPLRAVRTRLYGKPGVGDLYAGIKALELRSEREQLDTMYAFFRNCEALPAAEHPLRANLEAVAKLACPGVTSWAPAIGELAALIQR